MVQITGTESEVFFNKQAPSASLVFEAKTVPFHSRLNHAVREVVCYEYLWYGLIITYYATFFQDSVNKLFQDKTPGKSVVIKSLSATWLKLRYHSDVKLNCQIKYLKYVVIALILC